MRPRDRSTALWPFWLLIAAWFCANVPPTTTLHACAWLKGAGHFSHQQELRLSVAALLSGHAPEEDPRFAAVPVPPPDSLPPALPAESGMKKDHMTLLAGPLRLIGTFSPLKRPESVLRAPAAPVADVPYPPPRASTPA